MQKIVLFTLSKMAAVFNTKAEDLLAVIGPEVGFPFDLIWSWDGSPVKGTMQGGHHIDLKTANKWLHAVKDMSAEGI